MAHTEGIAVFIDGLNVRHRLRERGWCECYDVGYLARQLAGPRQLVGVYFYHPQPNQEHLGPGRYAAERGYLERVMRDEGVIAPPGAYMVKRVSPAGGAVWIEKQTDVLLGTDLVYMAAKELMDRAVVATADADLVPAIRRCIDLDIPVEVLRFRGSTPRIWELESVATVLRRARPVYFRPYDAEVALPSNQDTTQPCAVHDKKGGLQAG
jgi:uncharacterized LabA/DUF88 family protein